MKDKRKKLKADIIKEIRLRIKAGILGSIDYHYDGKRVIKDNINFNRNEFFDILNYVLNEYETRLESKK